MFSVFDQKEIGDNSGETKMKVTVFAKFMVTEVFEIEVDSEDEIRDKAWDVSYDYLSKYETEDVYDVEWEIQEDE